MSVISNNGKNVKGPSGPPQTPKDNKSLKLAGVEKDTLVVVGKKIRVRGDNISLECNIAFP